MFVEEVGKGAIAFCGVADDRRWFAVAWSETKMFERREDSIILSRIHAVHLPAKRLEDRLKIRHGKHHAVVNIQLPVVAIDEDTKVVEMALSRVQQCFPDRAFLKLSIADNAIGVESVSYTHLT